MGWVLRVRTGSGWEEALLGEVKSYWRSGPSLVSQTRWRDSAEGYHAIRSATPDPYEVPRNEWQDDVDLWPAITYIHLGMYLLLTPSPYTGEDLMNYKSLDCYKNFVSGWVREVLVKEFSDMRVVVGKVRILQ